MHGLATSVCDDLGKNSSDISVINPSNLIIRRRISQHPSSYHDTEQCILGSISRGPHLRLSPDLGKTRPGIALRELSGSPGRPPISAETKNLILRMATENRWRARKIQAELSKLGVEESIATIARYLPKTKPDPDSQQRWVTFLRNHRDVIAGMDFFLVPTVRFQLLYVWFAIDHGRRRILHFNATANPVAQWVSSSYALP